jgi:3-oxoacyl-[acyl-carrier protein] reductase
MMDETLRGRRAIVCGSTQGIGKACAIALARAGATVTLLARDAAALGQTCAELPAAKGAAHGFAAVDFADWRAVRTCAEEIVRRHGAVHVLVNNTGGPPAGPASEAEPEAFERAFAMHVLGNQVLARAVLPGMKEARYGRIVNVISTSVIMPIAGLGVSNTIRGAVANWARTVAAEAAPFGVTVNNVLPGYTDTARLRSLIRTRAEKLGCTEEEMAARWRAVVPAGRFGAPEEIAAVVAFLASPAASYVTGVNLPVDGGRLAAS